MKHYLFILLCCLTFAGQGQVITTVVGGGSNSNDSVPALMASIYHPIDLEFDKQGNLYFISGLGHKLQRLDTNGIVTVIAGTGSGGYNGDGGLADTSKIKNPGGFTIDSVGNIFIADKENHRIRRVDATSGIITTIAGTGISGYNGEGIQALTAQLAGPADVRFDKFGNLYVSEFGNVRIRKITSSGIISTYVGTGTAGYSGDGGLATSAEVGLPQELITDADGNLYFSDFGNISSSVRKVDRVTGIITTIAGTGSSYLYNGDNIPAVTSNLSPVGICFDSEYNLYVGDWLNNRIRKIDANGIIHTVAGDGVMAYGGDGGPALSAQLNRPVGVRFDSCDNLYLTQIQQSRIRKVSFNPNCFPLNINEKTPLSFTLSPNPATSQLTITSNTKLNDITITNSIGQTVLQQKAGYEKTILDVSILQSGIYFVSVTNVHGEKRTERVLISP